MVYHSLMETRIPKGKLTLLGARPAMGMQTFSISWAHRLAENGQKVCYFSMDLGEKAFFQKLERQCAGEMGKNGLKNLSLEDTPSLGLSDLRQYLGEHTVDVVVIDPLHLLEVEQNTTDHLHQIPTVIRDLQQLAADFQVSMLALVELSRTTEDRKDKRPTLEDLNEQIAVDWTGNPWMFLHREEYDRHNEYHPNGQKIEGKAELISFDGDEQKIIPLYFDSKRLRFLPWSSWPVMKDEIRNTEGAYVHIGEGDFSRFEADQAEQIQVFAASTEDLSEDRMADLYERIVAQYEASEWVGRVSHVMLFIAAASEGELTMDEMEYIHKLLEHLCGGEARLANDCLTRFGIAPRPGRETRLWVAVR